MFSDNAAQDGGGAVYSEDYSEISYDLSTNIRFSGKETNLVELCTLLII